MYKEVRRLPLLQSEHYEALLVASTALNFCTCESKILLIHAVKAHMDGGAIAPRIHNLDTKWRCV